MKRLLLFVVLSILATSFSFSQKIYCDRIEEDGSRQIMLETKKFTFDDREYNLGLKVFVSQDRIDWLLLVSSFSRITESAIVLIKLGNDEVIELPVNNVRVGNIATPATGIHYGSISHYYPGDDRDYYSSVYVLTEGVFAVISEYGIKKMRIYDGTEYRDRKRCDGIADYLEYGARKLWQQMKNDRKKEIQNVYEGF